MVQITQELYPSARLMRSDQDLDQRLEKKLNDENSFKNHINNIKDMIIYFRDRNTKSEKNYKKNKTLTTKSKTFDTFVIIAKTSSSITLSLTRIGVIAIPISTATACGLSNVNNVVFEIIINKKKKYSKTIKKRPTNY